MPLRKSKKDRNSEVKVEQPLRIRTKKVCLFCQNSTQPSYTDTATLRRFISDRSKIYPKSRSGACSKHQRAITKQIKYARHLSLLPFVTRVY
ncbi:30S ribosomal protein S18 [Candidatus Daviesbacteria bacterium]|nr:30S ribosomal protein S18 [Candidatus Daviesbacteria bacterium]